MIYYLFILRAFPTRAIRLSSLFESSERKISKLSNQHGYNFFIFSIYILSTSYKMAQKRNFQRLLAAVGRFGLWLMPCPGKGRLDFSLTVHKKLSGWLYFKKSGVLSKKRDLPASPDIENCQQMNLNSPYNLRHWAWDKLNFLRVIHSPNSRLVSNNFCKE